MSDDTFGWESPVADRINHERVAVRAEMDAKDVQLFAVRDDTPINRHVVREDAKLDETPELPNHLQTLDDCGRMAGRFNVDIAPVALRHVFDFLHDVFFQRVHDKVGAEFPSE